MVLDIEQIGGPIESGAVWYGDGLVILNGIIQIGVKTNQIIAGRGAP